MGIYENQKNSFIFHSTESMHHAPHGTWSEKIPAPGLYTGEFLISDVPCHS